jgi:3-oxoacyl-[acyl-carrier protein] reductase|tara:strand:+ start:826 stop:1566 length:741 start_codon:yes stop_codon:yes gene_type:complete
MRLKNKIAIVTGGGSGFGAGIVKKFIQEGAKVVVADINLENAKKVAMDTGGFAVEVDVSNSLSFKNLVDKTLEKFGKIEIMVNNAGITHLPNSMENISEAEFDKIFAVNSKSVFFSAKYLVPKMTSIGGGNILNVASTAGISPRPNLSWYNATKGWMISATKAMAIELASKKIRVNALAPVAGETPLLKSFMGGDTPEKREKFLSTIPIGRFSTPNDMGNAACFLCSEEASMITGVVLQVDGGRCI